MTVTVLISRAPAEAKHNSPTPGDFKAQMVVNGYPQGKQLVKPGCRDLGAAQIQAQLAVRELFTGPLAPDKLTIEFTLDPSAQEATREPAL